MARKIGSLLKAVWLGYTGCQRNPIVNSYFVLLHAFGGQMFAGLEGGLQQFQAIEALEFLHLLQYARLGVAEFDSEQEGQTLL